MGELAGQRLDFLLELFSQTEGDVEKQASMHDVGAVLGLEKHESGSLAEELILDEIVELKTLAGGISITPKGLEMLSQEGYAVTPIAGSKYNLSGQAVLTDDDKNSIQEILQELRTSVSGDYQILEELVIDMKTIEVQLLSPNPKSVIVKEIFKSIKAKLNELKQERLVQIIAEIVN